jgi:hypothetical protein
MAMGMLTPISSLARWLADRSPVALVRSMRTPASTRFVVTRASSDSPQDAQAILFDPLVVDDTVELDRYLSSGRLPTTIRYPLSSQSPSTSSSVCQSPQPTSYGSRPKLSDQL